MGNRKGLWGMAEGRTIVVCFDCKKQKINYGFNRCNGCLRNYKRRTRPRFYLGTCYSEICRRVKTKTKTRTIYYGLNKCTREEFIARFENDHQFLTHFSNWQKNGYKRGLAPSIDRIDNTKGYEISNLQFLSNVDNAIKANRKETIAIREHIVLEFNSSRNAADFFNISQASITKAVKNKHKCVGYMFEFA